LILVDIMENEEEEAQSAAHSLNIPLKVLRVSSSQEVKRWAATVILVRPDHFVAYVGENQINEMHKILAMATGQKKGD